MKIMFLKGLKLNIHAPGTGAALILLAITQMPVAIESATKLVCIYGPSKHVGKLYQKDLRYRVNICVGGG